jgi:EpsI family protein
MMNSRRRSGLLVLALIVLTVWGAHAWTPTRHMADLRPKIELEALFPRSFGNWKEDTRMPLAVISPDQAEVLNRIYNQTLSRSYVNDKGERVMLSVAYGGDQSDGTSAHRPEVCYPAQGFQITGNRRVSLSIADRKVSARQLESKLGGRYEPVTYWIVIAEQTTTSGTEQKLAQLRYGLRGLIPDGMLVRVSTIDRDSAKAYELQESFLREMAQAMPDPQRALVFGGPSPAEPTASLAPIRSAPPLSADKGAG